MLLHRKIQPSWLFDWPASGVIRIPSHLYLNTMKSFLTFKIINTGIFLYFQKVLTLKLGKTTSSRQRFCFALYSPLSAVHITSDWGARVAQWWEHSPPTNVARVQIPASTPYVGWVCCWFSPFLREVFPGTPVFPSPQKPTFPNSNSTRNQVDEEPLCRCATCKSLFYFIYLFIYLFIVRDSEPIRLLESPRSLSVYILIRDIHCDQ